MEQTDKWSQKGFKETDFRVNEPKSRKVEMVGLSFWDFEYFKFSVSQIDVTIEMWAVLQTCQTPSRVDQFVFSKKVHFGIPMAYLSR